MARLGWTSKPDFAARFVAGIRSSEEKFYYRLRTQVFSILAETAAPLPSFPGCDRQNSIALRNIFIFS
jgi:hypothetical protein